MRAEQQGSERRLTMRTATGPADPSLMRVVERLLPLATYYTGIDSFMELR